MRCVILDKDNNLVAAISTKNNNGGMEQRFILDENYKIEDVVKAKGDEVFISKCHK